MGWSKHDSRDPFPMTEPFHRECCLRTCRWPSNSWQILRLWHQKGGPGPETVVTCWWRLRRTFLLGWCHVCRDGLLGWETWTKLGWISSLWTVLSTYLLLLVGPIWPWIFWDLILINQDESWFILCLGFVAPVTHEPAMEMIPKWPVTRLQVGIFSPP